MHPSLKPIEAKYQSQALKKYNAGFAHFLSALMWVQLLQQSSHQPIQDGKVSWEFTHVDGITELDPQFDRAYSFGSTFLSVFKQDVLGSQLILEKWVKRRPYYWRANYLLGFHYFSELDDASRGSEYILKASAMENAPSWTTSLGVRMLSETGALAQALRISIELYPGIRDDEGRTRLKSRVRSLNYALQKKGWEAALHKYRKEQKAEPQQIQDLRSILHSEVRGIASLFDQVPEDLKPLLAEPFQFYYDASSHSIQPMRDPLSLGITRVGVERKKK